MSRGKELPYHLRVQIVTMFDLGKRICEIVRETKCKRSAIRKIISKWRETRTVANIYKTGRARLTNRREDRRIVTMFEKSPKKSAFKASKELEKRIGTRVSETTIRRRLHEAGLKGRKPRKKPLLSIRNIRKRLTWAKEHVKWTDQEWSKIIWSDESKYCIFGNDGPSHVWRKNGEAPKPKNVIPTVKHGGGKLANIFVSFCPPYAYFLPMCNFFRVSHGVGLHGHQRSGELDLHSW